MGLLFQGGLGKGCGWLGAVAWVGLCCGGGDLSRAQTRSHTKVQAKASGWDEAVAARERFEAEPAKAHTRQEYARVMNGFRAIYHADPGAAHAARAMEQVAELLAEQGHEFGDKKSLRDAAGQYEYVAKAYPGGALAPEALVQALDLLGPDAAGDAVEARKVRAQIVADYPRYVRGLKAGAGDVAVEKPASMKRDAHSSEQVRSLGNTDGGQPTVAQNDAARVVVPDRTAHPDEIAHLNDDGTVVKMGHTGELADGSAVPVVAERASVGGVATVTGIRHWSTASYTRVAIDLNVDSKDNVKYEAARVENPDRLFFDLQHARLVPGLAGKSFTVTDDGFLTKIRAAQFSDDVTRVVLDVHEVAEYSAFLLPNPTRLIIDIHGKQGQGPGLRVQGSASASLTDEAAAVAEVRVPSVAAQTNVASVEVPVVRGGGVSSLPPMPVTDGSAGFGLPARSAETGKTVVERPRVVISSKPTVAKPVPNTVTRSSSETGTEVAAVSLQPGKVEATRRPTSRPISSGMREPSSGMREQGLGMREPGAGIRDDAGASSRSGGAGNSASAAPVMGAPPTADGQTSLMRALGLKIGRIVIDAGHGGHDSGTLGVGGIEEKDVVLDVALRLGKLLHDRLGAEIVYTRADDTFIPLETRTAIANKAQADLFISVHANSSQDASARGVEVYYLNFTSDPEAMTVASRENAVSTESVHELSDLVKKIALKDKIEESKELASDVDASLYGGLRRGNAGLKDRGVKKAPFVVLIGANMPSILAEISFVTNPEDAAQLAMPEYRERVAESLYKGVARYAAAINGQAPRETKTKVRTMEQAER
jgi:N-acetylmuramoyl-L-alanine amidase